MSSLTVSLKEKFFNGALSITLMSVLFGFLLGGIIMLLAGFNPLEAYWVILKGIFSRPKYVSYVIIYSTPLIITGLSVAFALRTGLFNIGAEGQFIMGALAAAAAGYYLKLPMVLHVFAAVGLAVIVAGVWGGAGRLVQSPLRGKRGNLDHHAQLDSALHLQLGHYHRVLRSAGDRQDLRHPADGPYRHSRPMEENPRGHSLSA